jgi:hypothetical protein
LGLFELILEKEMLEMDLKPRIKNALLELMQRREVSRDDSNPRPKQSFSLQAFDSSSASPLPFNPVITTHKGKKNCLDLSSGLVDVDLSPLLPFTQRKELPQGNSATPAR